MNANEKIKALFLKKVETMPIEAINVSILCDELKIKRQTFYYYYRDIYDLTDSILIGYKSDLLANDFNEEYLEKIINFTHENIIFLNACANSSLESLIHEFIYDLLLKYVNGKVLSFKDSEKLNNTDTLEISSFLSEGTTNIFVSALDNVKDFSSTKILNKIEILTSNKILNDLINDYYENRKRI